MRIRTSSLVCFLILAFTIPALAQYGHPLKGTWSGEWWVTRGQENRVLLEFNWDGKQITGTLNPGPNPAPLQKVSLEPPAGGVAGAMNPWALHFEADVKDQAGRTVRHVVDGKLVNLGAYNRVITGNWTAGAQKGEFKVTLN